MKKLFIVVNVDWFFLSHRLPIALASLEAGYDVTIVAKDTGKRHEIIASGLKFIEIPFDRSGTNPISEFRCVLSLKKLYKQEQPDVIHHVTLKACLLGSIAAKLAGIRNVVNAISGFGYNFTGDRDGLKQKVLKKVMFWAFKSNTFHYIFQNPDDLNMFSELSLATSSHIHLIKGSGVNLNLFSYTEPEKKNKMEVVLLARMLYDKGIVEFIDAAKLIKNETENKVQFILVGDCDEHNLAGIKEADLREMLDEPYIKWIGFKKDVYSVLRDADIVVLPSYREGLPKTLIEACAVGRPIVTTETFGCKECVIENYNGYLVPVQNIDILAERILSLIRNDVQRLEMGRNSRLLAEKEFSIESVVAKHLNIYSTISN